MTSSWENHCNSFEVRWAVHFFYGCPIVKLQWHDDVIKWKHFPPYWPFVRGIHRSQMNSPHKGQWRGALLFSLICAWINDWVNNRDAGELRRHRSHYDVIVMTWHGLGGTRIVAPAMTARATFPITIATHLTSCWTPNVSLRYHTKFKHRRVTISYIFI